MNSIKHLIYNQFKIFKLLSVSIVFSMVLLMIRMKIMYSYLYLFLVWNLFLAAIPFAITCYLRSLPKLNKFGFLIGFGVWLLFLPNAPYIVTDLLHLKTKHSYFLWLDTLIISSFALNGLMLFYLSLIEMRSLLKTRLNQKIIKPLIISILFLSGFGVYLGRFLRYNSWEIIEKPVKLSNDILHIIIYPKAHLEAWLFTLLFSAFLCVGFYGFQVLSNITNNKTME